MSWEACNFLTWKGLSSLNFRLSWKQHRRKTRKKRVAHNMKGLTGNSFCGREDNFWKSQETVQIFSICRARNLQRSWDLSLANVKGLMLSPHCRKLEKYRCTQMSLRSGYEFHLHHNYILKTFPVSSPTVFFPQEDIFPTLSSFLWDYLTRKFPQAPNTSLVSHPSNFAFRLSNLSPSVSLPPTSCR